MILSENLFLWFSSELLDLDKAIHLTKSTITRPIEIDVSSFYLQKYVLHLVTCFKNGLLCSHSSF